MSRTEKLYNAGTSIWYDNISRSLLQSGELARLCDEWGVRGVTSNPTIFEKAIAGEDVYRSSLAELKGRGLDADSAFEELAVEDIREACKILHPVWEETEGVDGYVSIEVSPLLAKNTEQTIAAGRRIYEKLSLPNVMIKVPGTQEGVPAIRSLLEEGINVNVTLLFSVQSYELVANAYVGALSARVAKGLAVDGVRSVASFFVSRVDSVVDKQLGDKISSNALTDGQKELAQGLIGRSAIANSRLAYEKFESIFFSEEFAELRKSGAKVQRPLWASTGVKNPEFRDVIYIEQLVGPDTVNTLPHNTLEAFVDHGEAEITLRDELDFAHKMSSELSSLGIDLSSLLVELQEDGVKKFSESYDSLIQTISKEIS